MNVKDLLKSKGIIAADDNLETVANLVMDKGLVAACNTLGYTYTPGIELEISPTELRVIKANTPSNDQTSLDDLLLDLQTMAYGLKSVEVYYTDGSCIRFYCRKRSKKPKNHYAEEERYIANFVSTLNDWKGKTIRCVKESYWSNRPIRKTEYRYNNGFYDIDFVYGK